MMERMTLLSGGHGLGYQSLQRQLLLLEVIGCGLFDLELGHGVTEGGLDLLLVAALHLHRHAWVGDDLLNPGDV